MSYPIGSLFVFSFRRSIFSSIHSHQFKRVRVYVCVYHRLKLTTQNWHRNVGVFTILRANKKKNNSGSNTSTTRLRHFWFSFFFVGERSKAFTRLTLAPTHFCFWRSPPSLYSPLFFFDFLSFKLQVFTPLLLLLNNYWRVL